MNLDLREAPTNVERLLQLPTKVGCRRRILWMVGKGSLTEEEAHSWRRGLSADFIGIAGELSPRDRPGRHPYGSSPDHFVSDHPAASTRQEREEGSRAGSSVKV
jgi:hypothetical protein